MSSAKNLSKGERNAMKRLVPALFNMLYLVNDNGDSLQPGQSMGTRAVE